MVNEHHDPDENQELLLSLLKDGRDSDSPWGRANPLYFRKNTPLDKGQVEYALDKLATAGWIRRVNAGLYELVADPREGDRDE